MLPVSSKITTGKPCLMLRHRGKAATCTSCNPTHLNMTAPSMTTLNMTMQATARFVLASPLRWL